MPSDVAATSLTSLNAASAALPPVHSLAVDDIQTTYHPRSKCLPVIKSFGEYGTDVHLIRHLPPAPSNPRPWLPFHSEAEFEFSKLILEAMLSNTQIDALVKLVHRITEKKDDFKVQNHSDIEALWEKALSHLGSVSLMFCIVS